VWVELSLGLNMGGLNVKAPCCRYYRDIFLHVFIHALKMGRSGVENQQIPTA
jgi:hypothetical protein